jgi:hypothetical protein
MNRTQIAAKAGISYQLLAVWIQSGLVTFNPNDPVQCLRDARAVVRARRKGKTVQQIRVELAFERGKAAANAGR